MKSQLNIEREQGTDKIIESKENLTAMRKQEAAFNFMKNNWAYTEIEKAFGQYLFVPFDVPKIEFRDLEFFVSWFYKNAKPTVKQKGDFSSGNKTLNGSPYLTIDAVDDTWHGMFSKNSVPEVYTLFPEFFEQIREYLPWLKTEKSAFRWNMWSSSKDIIPHRDFSSCVDIPSALRIKLFDSNQEETLKLLVDPLKEHSNEYMPIPKLIDTNTFAWNNLRTKHKSVFHGEDFRKILFINRTAIETELQLQHFADLLERSINKYKNYENQVWVDTNSVSDYINLD